MSEDSNYIQSTESQTQINETCKKNSSLHRKLKSLCKICLFNVVFLGNPNECIRLLRRKNRSSLSAKSVRFLWKRSNSVKNRSKVEHTANVLHWNDRFSNTQNSDLILTVRFSNTGKSKGCN